MLTDTGSRPENCIQEIHTDKPDINSGFGGKYASALCQLAHLKLLPRFVWLIPEGTDDMSQAGTSIHIQIQDSPIGGKIDLATGAGGKYRYLEVNYSHTVNEKIRKVALYRKANGQGAVTLEEAQRSGFNHVSTDINAGRGGDYLHLVYEVGY